MRDDLMTRAEAAEYLGMSESWLKRHTPDRGGPAWRRFGRRVFYRLADLDAFIDQPQPTEEVEECPAPKQARTGSSGSGRSAKTERRTSRQRGGAGSKSAGETSRAARARQIAGELKSRLEGSAPKPRPTLQLVPEGAG